MKSVLFWANLRRLASLLVNKRIMAHLVVKKIHKGCSSCFSFHLRPCPFYFIATEFHGVARMFRVNPVATNIKLNCLCHGIARNGTDAPWESVIIRCKKHHMPFLSVFSVGSLLNQNKRCCWNKQPFFSTNRGLQPWYIIMFNISRYR